MLVIPFTEAHLDFLKLMNMTHKHSAIKTADLSMTTLPAIGYLAFDNGWPVAAGFLRRLEPCYGHLDTFVTNGSLSATLRHEALGLVTDALVAKAKEEGLKGLIATTIDKGIFDRSQNRGFKVVPGVIVGKAL